MTDRYKSKKDVDDPDYDPIDQVFDYVAESDPEIDLTTAIEATLPLATNKIVRDITIADKVPTTDELIDSYKTASAERDRLDALEDSLLSQGIDPWNFKKGMSIDDWMAGSELREGRQKQKAFSDSVIQASKWKNRLAFAQQPQNIEWALKQGFTMEQVQAGDHMDQLEHFLDPSNVPDLNVHGAGKNPMYANDIVDLLITKLNKYEESGDLNMYEVDALRHYYGIREFEKRYGPNIAWLIGEYNEFGSWFRQGESPFKIKTDVGTQIDRMNNSIALTHANDKLFSVYSDSLTLDDHRALLDLLVVPPPKDMPEEDQQKYLDDILYNMGDS